MRYLLYLSIILLFGCSSLGDHNIGKGDINLFGINTIKYVGNTSAENADVFEKILLKNLGNIDTLIIDSRGGDVFGGMHIGRLVNEYGLKVIVKNICASSCANYIATASNDVTIEKGALLGWHGGATQPIYSPLEDKTPLITKIMTFFSDDDKEKAMNDFIKVWQNKEIKFFEMVGVKQAVTIIGIMPGLKEKRDSELFSYDIETLKRLGLRVKFEGGEQSKFSENGDKIVQIFKLSKEKLDSLLKTHNRLTNKKNS